MGCFFGVGWKAGKLKVEAGRVEQGMWLLLEPLQVGDLARGPGQGNGDISLFGAGL
ncbi:MAG: hypothetical protein HQP61_11325 [Peptococcaceae bacterium]|nr:hypothetical protein [Candidatus Syntrophopropionicum ammoniitolerans]